MNLLALAKHLAGGLTVPWRKKPTERERLEQQYEQSTRNIGAYGESAIPLGGLIESPFRKHIEDLEAERQGYRDTLAQPMPEMQQAQADPIEQIVSALAGLTLRNPAAQSRALMAPTLLAGQRADAANARTSEEYKRSQDVARAGLGNSTQLIGAYLDRDQAAAKLLSDRQMAEFKAATAAAVARLKSDRLLMKDIAGLVVKGAPPEIVAMMLRDRDPNMTPEMATEAAAELTAGLSELDIKEAQLGLQGAKQTGDQANKLRDQLRKADTFEDRLAIIEELYPNWTPEQQMARAEKAGAEAQLKAAQVANVQSQTKARDTLLPEQLKALKARNNLTDKQAELVGKKVAVFDEEFRQRAAERYARLEKLQGENERKAAGESNDFDPQQKRIALNSVLSIVKAQIKREKAEGKDPDRLKELYDEESRIKGQLADIAGLDFDDEGEPTGFQLPGPLMGAIGKVQELAPFRVNPQNVRPVAPKPKAKQQPKKSGKAGGQTRSGSTWSYEPG